MDSVFVSAGLALVIFLGVLALVRAVLMLAAPRE